MNQNNLVRLRKHGYSIHGVREQIKNNLMGEYRSNRFSFGHYKTKKAEYKAFGLSMAEYIRDDDSYGALELINESYINCRGGWVSFMDEHFSDNFFHCQDCENIFSTDEEHNAYDDYSVCQCCADHNYHYSDRHAYYVRDDDEEEEEMSNIREYHTCSDHLGHIPSKYDARKPRVLLGLELEMEIKDSYSRDERAGELLENIGEYKESGGRFHQYALCENDGSLEHGFEMVTAYTGLDVHADQLKFFEKGLRGAISHDSDNCGLHVHICKADMTTLHGAKMILFINDQANHKLVRAIARRDDSDYAKIKNKKDDKYWLKDAMGCDTKRSQLRSLNADRYEALNFKNTNTVEFRLFKGSLVYSTIMSCLEFTYATWFFTRESSTKNLTTDHFLKFICANENRADTKNLRAYLKAKGFELPEKNTVVQFPKSALKTPSNQLQKVA
jgi:hypothetical protein